MQISIDKSVPIPADAGRRGNAAKYPFKSMNVGDSFFAEGNAKTIATAAHSHGLRRQQKFVVRTEGSGARVWRIS